MKQANETVAKKKHYAWAILVACCALNFGIGMTTNCSGQYFMSIAQELQVGIGQLTVYLTIRGVCLALATPFVGKILAGGRVKTKYLVTGSFAIVLIGTAAMGVFDRLWQWYVAGAITGVAGAFSFLLITPVLLNNWFSRRTGLITGIAFVFSGLGGAIFNPVLAWLIQSVGWRAAYVMNAAAAAVLVLPLTLLMVYSPAEKGLQPYGREDAAVSGASPRAQPAFLADRQRDYRICLLCLFVPACLIAFTACFSQHLASYALSIGLAAATGGWITSLCMLGNIAGKLVLGNVHDKYGARAMFVLGTGVVMSAFVLLLCRNTLWLLFAGALASGMGMSMVSVASPLLLRSVFWERDYSRNWARLSCGQGLVTACGTPLIGFMFDIQGSYRYSFVLGIVICALVLALLWGMYRTMKHMKVAAV